MTPRTTKSKLVEQGGLEERSLKLEPPKEGSYHMSYQSHNFLVREDADSLSIGSSKYDRSVIEAYSVIFNGTPDFRYRNGHGKLIIEWDKYPRLRLKVLRKKQDKGLIKSLVSLKN